MNGSTCRVKLNAGARVVLDASRQGFTIMGVRDQVRRLAIFNSFRLGAGGLQIKNLVSHELTGLGSLEVFVRRENHIPENFSNNAACQCESCCQRQRGRPQAVGEGAQTVGARCRSRPCDGTDRRSTYHGRPYPLLARRAVVASKLKSNGSAHGRTKQGLPVSYQPRRVLLLTDSFLVRSQNGLPADFFARCRGEGFLTDRQNPGGQGLRHCNRLDVHQTAKYGGSQKSRLQSRASVRQFRHDLSRWIDSIIQPVLFTG